MSTFVDDLLALKQMQSNRLTLVLQSFDPNQLFGLLGDIFQKQALMQKIKLKLPVSNQTRNLRDGRQSTWPLPFLIGDEKRLRQVLINLVKNALKFTRQQGSVIVIPYYDPYTEMLTVDVRDTGVGIAEEDLPQLFTRFGKLHRTATMNSEGIGLGLTIV